jgi:hypothetical protein
VRSLGVTGNRVNARVDNLPERLYRSHVQLIYIYQSQRAERDFEHQIFNCG